MKAKVFAAIFFFLGLLTVVIPRYILPVCEFNGYPAMFCSDAALYEAWVGSGIMFISLLIPLIPARLVRILFSILILAAGALVLFIPRMTGFCRNPSMPCNYGTIPALRLLGTGTFIAALLFLRSSWRERAVEN